MGRSRPSAGNCDPSMYSCHDVCTFALSTRYRAGTKDEKLRILDEFVAHSPSILEICEKRRRRSQAHGLPFSQMASSELFNGGSRIGDSLPPAGSSSLKLERWLEEIDEKPRRGAAGRSRTWLAWPGCPPPGRGRSTADYSLPKGSPTTKGFLNRTPARSRSCCRSSLSIRVAPDCFATAHCIASQNARPCCSTARIARRRLPGMAATIGNNVCQSSMWALAWAPVSLRWLRMRPAAKPAVAVPVGAVLDEAEVARPRGGEGGGARARAGCSTAGGGVPGAGTSRCALRCVVCDGAGSRWRRCRRPGRAPRGPAAAGPARPGRGRARRRRRCGAARHQGPAGRPAALRRSNRRADDHRVRPRGQPPTHQRVPSAVGKGHRCRAAAVVLRRGVSSSVRSVSRWRKPY